MIQKLNGPRGSTAIAPFKPSSPSDTKQNGPLESWGSWHDGKHYRIEVIQQPIRARMCGFGDKDRRPLAPATVAKLVVHDENDNPIDETDIDYSFFVVTADLWSADGKVERNLVLHPTHSDRYQSVPALKRRRTGAASASDPSPARSVPTVGVGPDISPSTGPRLRHSQSSPTSASFGPLSIPTVPALPSLSLMHPYNHDPPAAPPSPLSWPSLALSGHDLWRTEPDGGPFRTWSADPAYGTLAPLAPAPVSMSAPSPAPTFSPPPPLRSIELAEAPPPPPPAPPASPSEGGAPGHDAALYAPATRGAPPRAAPGHAYTRTLVGPLAASACRLCDQHRNPGVFFLFQDLSVRTEGSFRLRLRLMNIGAPPVSADGLPGVLTGSAPILAQTYTDAFDVYSAKRFPGVPDTTALSIAFGNQGQKLPLRNRHGSRKDGRRRRRGEDDYSDDESDGT